MADPLSISAGVIGVITAFVQSSQTLLDLVRTVKHTPNEVRTITEDYVNMQSLAILLKQTLEDPQVQAVVHAEDSIRGLIQVCPEGCNKSSEAMRDRVAKLTTTYTSSRRFGELNMPRTTCDFVALGVGRCG